MRALAHRSESPASFDVPATPRSALVAVWAGGAPDGAASPFVEPPPETDAWWLTRSQAPTFARRRIAIPDACARALRDTRGPIAVEFNGATFGGAALSANDGHYELDVDDALAREMAEVLDEDDGLDVELVSGRSQPTLALHPYVSDAR